MGDLNTFSTDGLVLKLRHTGESDRIVTVLTRDHGVLSAFAKGARRPKSRLNSGTQSFCFADFTFKTGRDDAMNITDAAVKEVFFDLNQDLVKLSLAQYFAQLAQELIPPEDAGDEPLRLLLNALYFLSKEKRPADLIKTVVELRLAGCAGYTPDFGGCAGCGVVGEQFMILDCREGVIFCPDCGRNVRGVRLSAAAIGIMRRISEGDLAAAFSVSAPAEHLREISAAAERYILTQTERGYSALDFLKSVKI